MASPDSIDPSDLVAHIRNDPAFITRLQTDPDAAVAEVKGTPLQTDVWIYRIVVVALAVVILAVVLGAIVTGKPITEGIIALAATSVGALGGLLAPSPAQAAKR